MRGGNVIGFHATALINNADYGFPGFIRGQTQIVIDAGYKVAFHAWDGLQYFDYIDRWHITRIEVSGEWDISTFASVVSF